MPSLFPGMDPFLEINPRWEWFHAWFVRKLAEQSLPKAQELGCWIDVERMVYQREPSGQVVLIGGPDEAVAADPSGPEWRSLAAVAVAEPKVIHELVLDPATLQRQAGLPGRAGVGAIRPRPGGCGGPQSGEQERKLRPPLPRETDALAGRAGPFFGDRPAPQRR